MVCRQNTRHLREGVSITQILFNIPYAHAHSASLASFHCNGRPRARAPIIIQSSQPMFMPTPKTVASTYVRYTTRASHIKGRQNKARAKRSHWLRRATVSHPWYGMACMHLPCHATCLDNPAKTHVFLTCNPSSSTCNGPWPMVHLHRPLRYHAI